MSNSQLTPKEHSEAAAEIVDTMIEYHHKSLENPSSTGFYMPGMWWELMETLDLYKNRWL